MADKPAKKPMDIRAFFAKRSKPDSNGTAPAAKRAKIEDGKKPPINLDSDDENKGASASTKPTTKRQMPSSFASKQKISTPARNSPEEAGGAAAAKQGGKKAKAKAKSSSKKEAPPAVDPNNKVFEKTFVFTGNMDETDREKAADMVKSAGGKVTSGVSGKTDYLVVGSVLEDGRPPNEGSKYRKALEQQKKGKDKPKIVQEAEFLALFGDGVVRAPTVSTSLAAVPNPIHKGHSLWTDKYRPHQLADMVGNANAVKKITNWLRDWEDVVVRGNKKQVAISFRGGAPENPNARAVLISGPPGIGKTTACGILARESGFVVIEYNASDSRTKRIVENISYVFQFLVSSFRFLFFRPVYFWCHCGFRPLAGDRN